MKRIWSIRVRTALVFAASAMALTTAALVFVNVASQRAIGVDAFQVSDAGDRADQLEGSGATIAPAPGVATGHDVDEGSVSVSVVVAQQWQWSAVAVVGVGLSAGIVGWFVSRRMLRPVDRITETAQRISAATLDERIGLSGPDDELRRLAATIDALLDRLERAFEGQRRFVAQAAHELRTPLAVQRAALQIDLTDDIGPREVPVVRAELLEQNRRTERLVESLLVLADAERGLDGGEPLDLACLVDDVVGQVRETADRAEVSVFVTATAETPDRTSPDRPTGIDRVGPAAPVLVGQPVLIGQLLFNLVDNAIEYNLPGGAVWVRHGTDSVVVENTGPHVDPSTVDTLCEPFRRGGPAGSRRHSGLGLSIVAAIARAHGWQLDIRVRDGGGLVVAVGVSSVLPDRSG